MNLDQERVLRKIEKCLRLSESDNPNEAAIALRHAQQLMQEHGLTQLDVAASSIHESSAEARAGQKPPRYITQLATMIGRAFGTRIIYTNLSSSRSLFSFIGEESAAKISRYAYEVMQRQLLRDRSSYLSSLPSRLKRSTKTRRADTFSEAWLQTASRALPAMQVTASTTEAIEHFISLYHETLTTLKTRDAGKLTRHDMTAISAGMEAGRSARLHGGLETVRREAIAHG